MPLINVTVEMFFDYEGLKNALDKKTNKVLSATGALSRTIMKRGMRKGGKKKAISEPRQYPRVHSGELRNLIYFGMDPTTKSLVVGPTFFKNDKAVSGSSMTVPQLINEGGSVTRTVVKKKLRRGKAPELITSKVSQHYRPRPFVELTRPEAVDKLVYYMDKIELKK